MKQFKFLIRKMLADIKETPIYCMKCRDSPRKIFRRLQPGLLSLNSDKSLRINCVRFSQDLFSKQNQPGTLRSKSGQLSDCCFEMDLVTCPSYRVGGSLCWGVMLAVDAESDGDEMVDL